MLDIRDIKDIITRHMNSQPYEIRCSQCGYDSVYTTEIDSDYDLKIQVEPCKFCTDSEANEESE